MFYVMPDETVLDRSGRVLFFSPKRFVQDICNGNRCFICGAGPEQKSFNDEHILPDWILKRYALYEDEIVMPTGQARKYGGYKIPCCADCNSAMGKAYEEPISSLINQGFDAVVQYVKTHGPWLIFSWLCLIFVKAHLKDREYRIHLDKRMGDERISGLYDWEQLHHIHCVARAFYSGCDMEPTVCGSLFLLQLSSDCRDHSFDFKDLYAPQTMLLRLGDIAFITVLNDSCAAYAALASTLDGLPVPLLPQHLRDFMALCAETNVRLSERPQFSSEFRVSKGRYVMTAHVPQQLKLDPRDPTVFGALLDVCRQEI